VSCTVSTIGYAHAAAKPADWTSSYSYSADSDNVTTRSYQFGTSEEQGLNWMYYRNALTQSGTNMQEDSLILNWNTPITDHEALSLWAGYSKNDFGHFTPWAFMYHNQLENGQNVWFSYGHEGIGTVQANQNSLSRNVLNLAYVSQLRHDLELSASYAHSNYNDGNRRNEIQVNVEKAFTPGFQMKAGYFYDDADFDPDAYWAPQKNKGFLLTPKLTFQLRDTDTLMLYSEIGLGVTDHTGSIRHYTNVVELHHKNFVFDAKYVRNGGYNAHQYSASWQFSM
jgi:hypothetical protein